MDDQTYAATIAQILPTLLVACVVEWRFAGRDWEQESQRRRLLNGVLWAAALISAFTAESVSLFVLATHTSMSKAVKLETAVSVLFIVGLLFYVPALLLLVNATAPVWVPPTTRMDPKAIALQMRMRGLRRDIRRERKWTEESLPGVEANARSVQELLTWVHSQQTQLRAARPLDELAIIKMDAAASEAERLNSMAQDTLEGVRKSAAGTLQLEARLAEVQRDFEETRSDRARRIAEAIQSTPPFGAPATRETPSAGVARDRRPIRHAAARPRRVRVRGRGSPKRK